MLVNVVVVVVAAAAAAVDVAVWSSSLSLWFSLFFFGPK